MPLAHLIFFGEPKELTDAQYEEARVLGHLRPDAPPAAGPVTGGGTANVTAPPAGGGSAASDDDDKTDES
jgi:hypothetical protein